MAQCSTASLLALVADRLPESSAIDAHVATLKLGLVLRKLLGAGNSAWRGRLPGTVGTACWPATKPTVTLLARAPVRPEVLRCARLASMSAKPFASGTISFGLVNIPVKLYSTGETSVGIQLNMLHRSCGSRLKQQYICPTDEEVVTRDEMVKGYEYSKGKYVILTEEEQRALAREATNAIAIAEFLPIETVDPIYFEKAYYLGPDKGGERPYKLLSEAMVQTKRAALASYAARGKDYLVLIRPFEGGMIMQQLRYHDELRPFAEVPVDNSELREPELRLAVQLVEQIATETFTPEKYEDTVRARTRELIEKKIQGEEITAAPDEAPRAQVIDLMAALKASLGAAAPARPRRSESQRGGTPPRKPPTSSEEATGASGRRKSGSVASAAGAGGGRVGPRRAQATAAPLAAARKPPKPSSRPARAPGSSEARPVTALRGRQQDRRKS
jgi:DNA end-binding protein Ku